MWSSSGSYELHRLTQYILQVIIRMQSKCTYGVCLYTVLVFQCRTIITYDVKTVLYYIILYYIILYYMALQYSYTLRKTRLLSSSILNYLIDAVADLVPQCSY